MGLYMTREPEETFKRGKFEALWDFEAYMFYPDDGLPVNRAIELFGLDAVARACNVGEDSFNVIGKCCYLTKRGAELAAAICNVELIGERYGLDDLRRDLRAMGLEVPGISAEKEGTGRQQATGKKRRRNLRAVKTATDPRAE